MPTEMPSMKFVHSSSLGATYVRRSIPGYEVAGRQKFKFLKFTSGSSQHHLAALNEVIVLLAL